MKIKVLIFHIFFLTFLSAHAQNISLVYNKESEKTAFAVQEVERILQEKGKQSVKYEILMEKKRKMYNFGIAVVKEIEFGIE